MYDDLYEVVKLLSVQLGGYSEEKVCKGDAVCLSATWLQNYSSQCGIVKKREREGGKSEEEKPRLLIRFEFRRYKPPLTHSLRICTDRHHQCD